MASKRYLIDELCTQTGFSRRRIRYFVQIGLIGKPAGRGLGGYYSDADLARLKKIRELLNQGLRAGQIAFHLQSPRTGTGHDTSIVINENAPAFGLSEPAELSLLNTWLRFSIIDGVELNVRADVAKKAAPFINRIRESAQTITKELSH